MKNQNVENRNWKKIEQKKENAQIFGEMDNSHTGNLHIISRIELIRSWWLFV